jgi:hypothetical protein
LISRLLSRRYGGIQIKLRDFWLTSLPDDTTVVYIFSVSKDLKHMNRYLQSETNRIGRSIHVISFGFLLDKRRYQKTVGPYSLYLFKPLHPQVK